MGVDEPWAALGNYKHTFNDADAVDGDELRVIWGKDTDGKAYVYYFVTYTDSNATFNLPETDSWRMDGFVFGVDEKGAFNLDADPGSTALDAHRCGTQAADDGAGSANGWLEYCVVRDGTKVYIEARTSFLSDANIAAESIIGLNVMVQANDGTNMKQIAWTGSNPSGGTKTYVKCTLKDKLAVDAVVDYKDTDNAIFYFNNKPITSMNATNGKVKLPDSILGVKVIGWVNRADSKLYKVGEEVTYSGTQLKIDAVVLGVELQRGASVFIENPSKLGFTLDVGGYDTVSNYISGMGVLTVEASMLTDGMIESGLTKELLAANGITPTDNKPAAKAAKYRAEISVTQNDTQYAAIAYVTVKYGDNTEVTYYSEFNKLVNVRSVQEVAAAAYNDRLGVKEAEYTYKQKSNYGVLNFEKLSYSPYANVQLDVLKVLGAL